MNKSLPEAKEETLSTGSCALTHGIHLVTGSEILASSTADDDYDVSGVIPDALYIQFGRNIFWESSDSEIEKILQEE